MLQKLIGSYDLTSFLACLFFAYIGVALSLLWHTTERNPNSQSTPIAFSWKFFLSDNVKRIVSGVLTIYAAIRFCPDVFGIAVNEYVAFGIGLGIDKIAEFIKSKTNLLDVNRAKINVEPK